MNHVGEPASVVLSSATRLSDTQSMKQRFQLFDLGRHPGFFHQSGGGRIQGYARIRARRNGQRWLSAAS